MREVLVSDETMENNNDNNTGGIEAIDANETVQENNPPDNVSTTNESESSVRIIWENALKSSKISSNQILARNLKLAIWRKTASKFR